jgi:elongation factor 3
MLLKKLVFFKLLTPNSSLSLQAKHAPAHDGISEEGELLCDTVFSLAYGALLLLSHTTLKLYRGRRYGILGPNGSGKSTLMRQLREGKVENFPPQDELHCVMVEHSLQGEDTSLSVIDFIASGEFPRLRTIILLTVCPA